MFLQKPKINFTKQTENEVTLLMILSHVRSTITLSLFIESFFFPFFKHRSDRNSEINVEN